MRLVFMGTPGFAAVSLDGLIAAGHTVAAVFCQPDKPSGRGMRLQACAVKQRAEALGIPVHQPTKLRDGSAAALLREIAPEAIAVVAYGRFLPGEILALPPLGCINVHGSLLPHLRGAAPIQWAVARGFTETGVTTQYMAEEMDTGDIILQARCDITPEDTAGTLHDRLAVMGADLLTETLVRIARGDAPRIPQNHDEASYAPLIAKRDGEIRWEKPLCEVDCHIRGMSPAPGAYFGGLRVHKAAKTGERSDAPPGTVLEDGCVVCGDGGVLALLEVQRAGGRRMGIEEYLRGHSQLTMEN